MTTIIDLIGETPLVAVTRLETGPCKLFLKLESANPSGSIKDRPARAMIEAAERDGRLKPGGTIIEATADAEVGRTDVILNVRVGADHRDPSSTDFDQMLGARASRLHVVHGDVIGRTPEHPLPEQDEWKADLEELDVSLSQPLGTEDDAVGESQPLARQHGDLASGSSWSDR